MIPLWVARPAEPERNISFPHAFFISPSYQLFQISFGSVSPRSSFQRNWLVSLGLSLCSDLFFSFLFFYYITSLSPVISYCPSTSALSWVCYNHLRRLSLSFFTAFPMPPFLDSSAHFQYSSSLFASSLSFRRQTLKQQRARQSHFSFSFAFA